MKRATKCFSPWLRTMRWIISRSPLVYLAVFGVLKIVPFAAQSTNSSSSSLSSSAYLECNVSLSLIGDGHCDDSSNTVECGYDGGDCCYCTCDDGGISIQCGIDGYDCQDPSADCAVDACEGEPAFIGDGDCDNRNNNPECDYDAGDCCQCTCVDEHYECGVNGYDCKDPTVTDECRSSWGGELVHHAFEATI